MVRVSYYAVATGRKPGIYETWKACQEQVEGFSKAKFKKFPTLQEAERYITDNQGPLDIKSHTVRNGTTDFKWDTPLNQQLTIESQGALTDTSDHRGVLDACNARASTNHYEHCRPLIQDLKAESLRVSHYERDPVVDLERTLDTCKVSRRIVDIYVDGACRGNGKKNRGILPAGYGVYYGPDHPLNSAVSLTTVDDVKKNKVSNQRAELFAIHHALSDIERLRQDPLFSEAAFVIHTDSQYSLNSLTKWAEIWRKNNWRTASGGKAMNLDIVIPSFQLLSKLNLSKKDLVRIEYVKGHLNIEGNEAADRLANLGADQMENTLRKEAS